MPLSWLGAVTVLSLQLMVTGGNTPLDITATEKPLYKFRGAVEKSHNKNRNKIVKEDLKMQGGIFYGED